MFGKITAWANTLYIKEESLKIKDFLKRRNEIFDKQFLIMLIISLVYIGLLYIKGIQNSFLKVLDLVKFCLLTPMLISSFFIDLKYRIIPNRLNMTMFEIGIFLTFLYGINNISIARNMLLGCLIGGGIFLGITILGGLIAGKEAMGFGDVKFMGACRIIFWNDSHM